MNGLYVIGGGLLGLVFGGMGGDPVLGLFAGLAIGYLFGRTTLLERQIDELTERQAARPSRQSQPEPDTPETSLDETTGRRDDAARSETHSELHPVSVAETAPSPAESRSLPPLTSGPTPSQRLFEAAKNWLTTGNVPVKVGVLVSFIGVSFLLKYAIDRNLLNLPIEIRLLGVALAGAVMMIIGWRLRKRRRVYALSLQGGGAGILFITVYTALRLWQLIPAPAAFGLLALLAALTSYLAVRQNARTLAVFAITGGFLAPLLASTGEGSHVVLFGYYLVINTAILGIAWFRAWRELNLLGFVFTFVIACFWGYNYFRPELFASTEPFLLLFFLFYQAIAILYAVRRPPDRASIVDGTLVFGTPVIAFGLQSALLYGSEYGLAISAAVLAVFYGLCAALLRRLKGACPALLTESYMALAVAFGTLAIPLAFDARWTAAAWALEGAALIWTGVRQRHHLANLAGFVLVLLSGFAFLVYGWQWQGGAYPVLNGNVLGGLMISLAALFTSRLLAGFRAEATLEFLYRFAATIGFAWGVLWWLATGWAEILDRADSSLFEPLFLLFTAASAAAAAWLGIWRDWRHMLAATAFLLPILALAALWSLFDDGHFLQAWTWLAWPLALAVQLYVLHALDLGRFQAAAAWHVTSLYFLAALVSLELLYRIDLVASPAWAASGAVAIAGLAALLVWSIRWRPAWPVPAHPVAYLSASLLLVVIQAGALAVLGIGMPGDADPWPYIPLLNPFGLGMLFAGLTAVMALRVASRDPAALQWQALLRAALSIAFFIVTTTALVRSVHQFTAVPWRPDALFDSVVVQTALSIYWGLLGFTGMVTGTRLARRAVWMVGAACMAVVVLKLFLVDLGNTGTVERIVSFIGTGALLLVVGYFAPAPPRAEAREKEA